MKDSDLKLVLAELKREHPTIVPHLKVLTAQQGTPVAEAATAVLQCLLDVFDGKQQALWSLRDLLQRQPKVEADGRAGFYWSLRYNATEMVYRIAVNGGADRRGMTYFDSVQPPEIANWKSDIQEL